MKPIFPPTGPESRRELVLILDVIEQLVWAAKLHYRRIQRSATRDGALADRIHADKGESEGLWSARRVCDVAIVADINALIGTIHRLRLLVNRLPGDAQTRTIRKAFAAQVRQVEEARHHLEHLDQAVREIADSGQGAFGTVSWWEALSDTDMRMVIFVPGTLAKGTQAVTKTPEIMRGRIDHVWTSIAGRHLKVTEAYLAVVRLEARLRDWGTAQAEQGWPALKK